MICYFDARSCFLLRDLRTHVQAHVSGTFVLSAHVMCASTVCEQKLRHLTYLCHRVLSNSRRHLTQWFDF